MSSRHCIDCGNSIPSIRVAAMPTATRCIKCQTDYEKNHDTSIKIEDIEGKEIIKAGKLKLKSSSICSPYSFRSPKLKNRSHKVKEVKPGLNPCPYCGVGVRPDRLEKHIKNVHTGTFCPYCNITIGISSLHEHIRRIHRDRDASLNHLVKSKDDVISKPIRPLNFNDNPVKSQRLDNNNLDQTKPYAHMFREHGRFGSHPSHDDFSDESTP